MTERLLSPTPVATRREVAAIVAGFTVVVIAGLAVRTPPAAWEESLFRRLNDLPHNVEPFLWVVQQMGSALVMPIAAFGLWWITRRWEPPVAILMAGFILGWLGAKVVKEMVGRGRPGAVLDDVVLGFDVPTAEIGFPSGHAVLAFTLATVFAALLSRRWQITAYVVAVVVGLTRIHVGAHFPLDVVGGAGYGIAIGTVAVITTRALTRVRTPSG